MKKSVLIFFIAFSYCFSQGQITDTIFHRVKKNETLYSISNQYSVDISEIIKLNPNLKDNRLKRRSRVLIPVYSKKIPQDIEISDSLNINTEIKYLLISLVSNFVPENSNLFT